MLVVSRKVNEGIHVGPRVRIVVLAVQGNRVRLGVEAPPEVPVHRDEVWESIRREEALAAGEGGGDDEE